MSEIHNLTDKELKKLEEAVSIVKKFAKYIRDVNATNTLLQSNLDGAIKAGDVTNAQKVNLRCYERAEEQYHKLLDRIRAICQKKDCDCEDYKHENCMLYQEFIVATWMHDVANGSDFGWEWIFKYACIGRKIMQGCDLQTAKKLETSL